MASSSWFRVCSLEKIAQPPHCFLIRDADAHLLASADVTAGRRAGSPLDEADRHRERWPLGTVGEAGHAQGLTEADRRVEDGLGCVRGAHQARTPAGDDHASREQAVEAALAHLFMRHLEDLPHPATDDLGQEAT